MFLLIYHRILSTGGADRSVFQWRVFPEGTTERCHYDSTTELVMAECPAHQLLIGDTRTRRATMMVPLGLLRAISSGRWPSRMTERNTLMISRRFDGRYPLRISMVLTCTRQKKGQPSGLNGSRTPAPDHGLKLSFVHGASTSIQVELP